jgi:predicted permease
MLQQIFLPFAFLFVGLAGQRVLPARERIISILSALISWVMLPAIIVASMSSMRLTQDVMLLPAASVVVVLALLVLGFVAAKILRLERRTAGSAVIAFGSLEGGSIGLALVLSLFGSTLLPEFFLFDVTQALLLFTVTYFVACLFGGTGRHSLKFARQFLLGPIPCAVAVALLLNVGGVSIDPRVYAVLNAAGYLILPAVMTILGLRFTFHLRYLKFSVIATAAKIVLGYLIALALVQLFEPAESAKAVILLGSCLPPSFLTLIFSEEQNLDSEFLSTFLPISALVSFTVLHFGFSMFPSLL